MENLLNLFPFFIVISIALVVVLTELIKMLDKNDRLKGYRVWAPVFLSGGAAGLLRIGNFFLPEQFWYWWVIIFGFSVFFFEAILKKLKTVFGHE